MNAIAKQYRKVTDKQVKINKELENQLQREAATAKNESSFLSMIDFL